MKPATALTLLLAALLAWSAAAQTPQIPSCASKLLSCASDLNATRPSAACCTSIKDAVANELSCLCGLLNNSATFSSLGVNITQALELPKRCGVNSDASLCKTAGAPGAPASPSGTPAAGTPATPSGTPATPRPSGNAASANSVTWTMMYVSTSSLFFWWFMA